MILHLVEFSTEPLHRQITRQIRAKVLSGNLSEGDPLPSIRAFAREHRVSVITVQHAYEDLEREGLVNSRRGKGFFVAGLNKGQKRSMAVDGIKRNLGPGIAEALAGGLSPQEILRIVQEILSQSGGKS
jgi:GntR family transcriptional regulator